MTAEIKSAPPPAAPIRSAGDLTSTLQSAAKVVEAVDVDGYREPGDIAADDAGASRLAPEMRPAPETKRRLEKTS
jgi:hypothetical protein